ncbi:haloperoxidase [Luteitalea sp. TBR-22]|nr:haloperoxidase [Luteitalea sp. TBR-22]
MVIEWNRVLNEAFATPGANPPTIFFTRPYAIMNVAIFDALNSIERRYQPYHVRVNAAPGASADAAVAQAAHDTLAAMMPSLRARFHAALMASLAPLPAAAAADGAAVGAAVAREILELRRHDGWSRTPPDYQLPTMAGYWQPTPPNLPGPAFTQYPDVMPFGLDGSQHFVPAPPPSMLSQRYTDDFNEVKSLGAVNSTTRTADQTQMARLAQGVGTTTGPAQLWNLVLSDLARSRSLSGLETARAFAMLNMALHDGFRVTMNGKYLYGLWRPVTAIREADRDGNPATEADPAWLPLITTPPYPSYPGNLACAGIVGATVLARTFGRNDVPFSVTWPDATGAPVATRQYNGFRQLADECSRARIWGGLHFEFDQTASKGVCEQVSNYVLDNQLRPLP